MEMEEFPLLYSPESLIENDKAMIHFEFPNSLEDFNEYDPSLSQSEPALMEDFDLEFIPEDFINHHDKSNSYSIQCKDKSVGNKNKHDFNLLPSASSSSSNSNKYKLVDLKGHHLNSTTNAASVNDATHTHSLNLGRLCPSNVLNDSADEAETYGRRYPVGDSNSKNAIAARDNRLKKKKYVAELEQTVRLLRSDNKSLSKEVTESRERINDLGNEVEYLRSVIANETTLSAILTSVSKTQGISLTTSFTENLKFAHDRNDRSVIENKMSLQQRMKDKAPFSKLRARRSVSSCKGLKLRNTKSVQNMTAKEIIICCKEKEKAKRLNLSTSIESETESDVEEPRINADNVDVTSPPPEHNGGICLHVTGNKVSLEFCAACNMKSNSDVSLDHSYMKK